MMQIIQYPLLVLLMALILTALPLGLLWYDEHRCLARWLPSLGKWATGLLVSAVLLNYVFLWDRPWLNMLWVVLATAVGALLTARRSVFVVPLAAGLLSAVVMVSACVFLVAGAGHAWLSARWIVPVSAWMVGCVAPACRRGLKSYHYDRRSHPDLYEYLLGNGESRRQALAPFVRKALQQAFSPLVSSYATSGMVALPALLCGMLIAGVDALQAVELTFLLMAAVLTATLIATVVAIWTVDRLNWKKKSM